MIKIQGVSKHYGTIRAVDGVDLEVARGDICVLIGPSGCGKSTLLRMINRMVEPDTGTILIDGKDIRDEPREVLRRRIGYVIQSIGLFPHLSVSDNIATVPRLLRWPPERIRSRTLELLELMGIPPDYGTKLPRQLSGGEAQRVGVARALAGDPPILLMDEPFGAVDPQNRTRLQEEFRYIQRRLKKTVVFVTHDVDEAIRLGDRIAVMRQGQVVEAARPEHFIVGRTHAFAASFLGPEFPLKLLVRYRVEDCLLDSPDDLATSEPVVDPGQSVKEALSLLVTRGVSRARVQGADGQLLGYFSIDCVFRLFREAGTQ